MGGGRRPAVLVGVVALLVAVAALFVELHGSPTTSTPGAAGVDVPPVRLGQTVHLESGAPSTRFLPLGAAPEDGRTLSAQHAYNLLVSGSAKLNPIPPTVRPYYGLLTDPAAPPGESAVRVWGFTVVSSCHAGGGRNARGAAPSSRGSQCRLWEFVDARSGRDLGLISEQVLPE